MSEDNLTGMALVRKRIINARAEIAELELSHYHELESMRKLEKLCLKWNNIFSSRYKMNICVYDEEKDIINIKHIGNFLYIDIILDNYVLHTNEDSNSGEALCVTSNEDELLTEFWKVVQYLESIGLF